MVVLEAALQVLIVGLLVGCVYGLLCSALSLIFGVMRVVNFAQGEFLMVGMFFSYFVAKALIARGFPASAAVLSSAALSVPVFFFVGRGLYSALLKRASGSETAQPGAVEHQAQLILTLGLSLIAQNLALMLFGTEPKSISTPVSSDAWIIGSDNLMLFVNKGQFFIAIIATTALVILTWLMNASDIGRRMRASANNAAAATYVGIDVRKYYGIAMGLSFALTAMIGSLMITYLPFQPFTGFDFVIIMYAGVVLGGMGTWTGAFLGGLTIGLIQQASNLFLSAQLQNAVVFGVFLLVILLRPQGLFGRNALRV